MRKPTPAPSTTQIPPSGGLVPLAVWATAVTGESPSPSTPRWLPRLLAEYTPASGRSLLLTESGRRQRACPPASQPADSQEPATPAADLVVVLSQLRRPPHGDIRPAVLAARRELRPGGLLAVVTRARPTGRQPHADLVSRSVRAATSAGLGYLQHLIIIELPIGEAAPPRPAGIPVPALHRTAHLDIAIFRLPPGSPHTAAPAVSSGR